MWYVYFLELSNKDIHVGYTRDLKQRFQTHNNGEVQATKGLLPAKLKSYVSVDHRSTAQEKPLPLNVSWEDHLLYSLHNNFILYPELRIRF